MGKSRFLFELSFFIYIAYIFIGKFSENAMAEKIAFIACGVALLYEILYIAFLHNRDMMSFGRTLATAGVFFCLDVMILMIVFVVFAFMRNNANVINILSSVQFSAFYEFPVFLNLSIGNLIIVGVCLIYIIAFYVITNKIDHRITF